MGGKRKKSSSGPVKKESKYKIPARFDCPLCDAKSSIAVKIHRALGIATVHCRACNVGRGSEHEIRPLEMAVDVFFRFRENLIEQDQHFLQHGNSVSAAYADEAAAGTGLASLVKPRELAKTRSAAERDWVGEPSELVEDASHYFAQQEASDDDFDALLH